MLSESVHKFNHTFCRIPKKLHPTEKPVDLIKELIYNSSNENDIVLDCFMGSGTTAVSCIKEKRNYIGFEINKEFYNTCLKRIKEVKEE